MLLKKHFFIIINNVESSCAAYCFTGNCDTLNKKLNRTDLFKIPFCNEINVTLEQLNLCPGKKSINYFKNTFY